MKLLSVTDGGERGRDESRAAGGGGDGLPARGAARGRPQVPPLQRGPGVWSTQVGGWCALQSLQLSSLFGWELWDGANEVREECAKKVRGAVSFCWRGR
jgi:hypothetical protein